MKYITTYFFSIIFSLVIFFVTGHQVFAGTFPLPNTVVIVKSISNGRVVSTSTDANGNFTTPVPEENGAYNVFFNDESMPPIKIIAQKSTIAGRIVILTDGTTTKDVIPPASKKVGKNKKAKVSTKA